MKISITGLAEIRARLQQVQPAEVMATALAEQAERLAEAVRAALSEPQGEGGHDKPWVRTGALRDSIAVTASGLEAAIGSNDPAAAPQEMGTSRIPPRPFLAPVASALGEDAAHTIARAMADALSGNESQAKSSDQPVAAEVSSTLLQPPGPARPTTYVATSPGPPAAAVTSEQPRSTRPATEIQPAGDWTTSVDGRTAGSVEK